MLKYWTKNSMGLFWNINHLVWAHPAPSYFSVLHDKEAATSLGRKEIWKEPSLVALLFLHEITLLCRNGCLGPPGIER